MTYYSSTSGTRIGYQRITGLHGVTDGHPRSSGWQVIGTAVGIGFLGDRERGTAEQVWGLTVGRVELEGAYVLRDGVFVELGEDSGWLPNGTPPMSLEEWMRANP